MIVALVRAEGRQAAARRLARAWWDDPQAAAAIGSRVEVLAGDVSMSRLGLDEAAYDDLVRRVTHIIHTAADLRLDGPPEELRATNVRGTVNLLDLARAAHCDHGLTRFAHLSTAYVAGKRRGEVSEEDLDDACGFNNAYESTKYEGERLVRAAAAELPITIFRPGMIVGDSRSGAIHTFNTLYYPLRLYLSGKLRFLPANPALRVNLVPVDYVVEAVARLTFDPRAAGLTYHLTAPSESLPTARELLEYVRAWAEEQLRVRLPRPVWLPTWIADAGQGKRLKSLLPRDVVTTSVVLLPYLNEQRRFRRDNLDRHLGTYPLDWRAILSPILEYAVYHSFFHRSERTVYEQILFRMASTSRPVTCYDIIEQQPGVQSVVARDSAKLREEMLAAARALGAMGIGPGSRVALVGLNSSRYLALDVAIGLVGAASVPLYYTSPPAEIDEMLAATGARALFVGAPRVAERLHEITSDVPVILFGREPTVSSTTPSGSEGERPSTTEEKQSRAAGTLRPAGQIPSGSRSARRVLSWTEFLAMAPAPSSSSDGERFLPLPRDLATVRCTSGTTGQVKGVCFDHAALRWMAEALVSMYPWRARNRRVRYLSSLPMSHVVEGIIAAYSPYYVPAPVEIYFLEDFHGLQQALCRVRPTIFFSVPRFYEKVWEALRGSPLGRVYLRARDTLAGHLLRPLVARTILARAGLNRCVQLIVGSAPPPEDLLRDYHRLGIEVHNAYGLTEAPLVALNRPGANHLGTVGRPLPATELRIADDGEVLVRGPQVTSGYLDPALPSPLEEGWLRTGDLGALTAAGDLVLQGRKKELIVTSYGKKFHPAKVESLLREIPGVDEALVVGDNRPFCGAILWLGRAKLGADGPAAVARAVAAAIAAANTRLAHPEQVKRWALLENDLSIEHGDLTANLKLKRCEVAARLAGLVAALYGGPPSDVQGLVHIGGEQEP